jgi:hypothetical protein
MIQLSFTLDTCYSRWPPPRTCINTRHPSSECFYTLYKMSSRHIELSFSGSKVQYSSRHQLHDSRPQKDFNPLTARLQVNSTASLALLRCEFWVVFTRVGSAARVATLYYFTVTLKHAICWRLLLSSRPLSAEVLSQFVLLQCILSMGSHVKGIAVLGLLVLRKKIIKRDRCEWGNVYTRCLLECR